MAWLRIESSGDAYMYQCVCVFAHGAKCGTSSYTPRTMVGPKKVLGADYGILIMGGSQILVPRIHNAKSMHGATF